MDYLHQDKLGHSGSIGVAVTVVEISLGDYTLRRNILRSTYQPVGGDADYA